MLHSSLVPFATVLHSCLSALLAAAFAAPAFLAPQQSPSNPPEPERGYAAFYSSSLEGHKTACGGVYSPAKLTAAHRSLPCGTRLRVTNIRNGKSVRVTVTDHGPFSNGRIIDLSYEAARRLDFLKQGTTLVKLDVLR